MPGNGDGARYIRFGVFEFDTTVNELRKHGIRLKVPVQPLLLLRTLLEKPGEILTREDLQKRIWPEGTFVDYEQSLNKAVNKLREALGDSADRPLYIETLSRRGYRFVAPVEAAPPIPAPIPVPALPAAAPPPKRKIWPWTLAAALIAAILITGVWPPSRPGTKVTALTADSRPKYPLLAVIDGRVVYSTSVEDLWSVPTSGGAPRREPKPCASAKEQAYLYGASYGQRQLLVRCWDLSVASGKSALWLFSFDYTNARPIEWPLEGDLPVSLSPDGKALLFSRKEGLFIQPLDGGRERLLVRIEWTSPSFTFWHPFGTRIGFSLTREGRANLWEVSADGTGMKPLLPGLPIDQGLGLWSPGGERLYFVSGPNIYVQESRGMLGWMRKAIPAQLTTGSTRFQLSYEDPTNSRVLYTLGYEAPVGELMKLNRKTNAFERYLDGLSAEGLDFSPDGRWIAYTSFPDGHLWKCRRDGSGRVLLEDRLFNFNPRWSPDGSRILFAATTPGQRFRIYTIPSAGGKPEPVPGAPGPAMDPTWSPDGKRIVFAPFAGQFNKKEDDHVSIVKPETGEVEAVPGSEGIWSTRWSPDGNWLAGFAVNRPETLVYSFAARKWSVIWRGAFGYEHWSKDSRYLYGVSYRPAPTLIRIEVATQKVEEIRRITEFELLGTIGGGASWTPDDEPVVLRNLTTPQIYRIEREH